MATGARHAAPKTAIRMRISIKGHTTTIWRRLVVPGEIKLSKLHSIFQAAMGWEDYHLHLFKIGDATYGVPDEDIGAQDIDVEDVDDLDIDDDTVVLADVLTAPLRFSYQYDFGDNWQHEVVVESIETVPLMLKSAVCIDGARACPPEDCGGTGGYGEFLEAISDPEHEEHGDCVRWVGWLFDPEAFSLAAVNAALQRVR